MLTVTLVETAFMDLFRQAWGPLPPWKFCKYLAYILTNFVISLPLISDIMAYSFHYPHPFHSLSLILCAVQNDV